MQNENIHVSGRGFATYKIPAWIFLPRFVGALFCASAAVLLGVWLSGWDWVATGFSNKVAAAAGTMAVIAFMLFYLVLRSRFLSSLWNLRKEGSKIVYGGNAGALGAALSIAIVAVPLLICTGIGNQLSATFPVPRSLKQIKLQTPAAGVPLSADLQPVFLWDYATAYNPAWFDDIEIVLPYEKGPPQKLLGSFYLQNRKTRALVASFHGKRPRQYDPARISELFSANENSTSVFPPLASWPLLYTLTKEAGASGSRELDLFENQITQNGATATTRSIGVHGRVFLWGPDGGVFQVRCVDPCAIPEILNLARFPQDPTANLKERQDLTKRKLRALLESYPKDPAARTRHETELTLALISWLTLDPRDPEAFFHIGKLATNRETLNSAIRYGRDLNMNPAQLAELEAGLSRFSY